MDDETRARDPGSGKRGSPTSADACMITERWVGTTLYSADRRIPRDPWRGLDTALDHLDELGLCCCWVAPRRHPLRRAA